MEREKEIDRETWKWRGNEGLVIERWGSGKELDKRWM